MGKRSFNHAIPSSEFAEAKVVKYPDGATLLDMRGDSRLDNLLAEVKSEIAKNGWKVPENEKEICEKTADLMLSEKYYGPYSESALGIQVNLAEVEQKLSDIEVDIKCNVNNDESLTEAEKAEKLEELKQQKEELTEQVESLNQQFEPEMQTNLLPLKDVPYGKSVCVQQAGIMSYVMGNVGLPNDYCLGPGFEVSNLNHAFVQSKSGDKNIIDSTLAENSGVYYYNRNGGEIAKDEIVMTVDTKEEDGLEMVLNYGGGKTITTLGALFKDRAYQEVRKEHQPQTPEEYRLTMIQYNRDKASDEFYKDKNREKEEAKKDDSDKGKSKNPVFKKGDRFSANEAGEEPQAEYAKIEPHMVSPELAANLQNSMQQDSAGADAFNELGQTPQNPAAGRYA